jgi:hypothetical protein
MCRYASWLLIFLVIESGLARGHCCTDWGERLKEGNGLQLLKMNGQMKED